MIFSVSEANNFIKALLDAVPQLQTIFVRGEISNYKLYPSGRVPPRRRIPALLFRAQCRGRG